MHYFFGLTELGTNLLPCAFQTTVEDDEGKRGCAQSIPSRNKKAFQIRVNKKGREGPFCVCKRCNLKDSICLKSQSTGNPIPHNAIVADGFLPCQLLELVGQQLPLASVDRDACRAPTQDDCPEDRYHPKCPFYPNAVSEPSTMFQHLGEVDNRYRPGQHDQGPDKAYRVGVVPSPADDWSCQSER
jgi:hypothetical protein